MIEKAGVSPSEVSRVVIWGNHSESAFVDYRNAQIAGRPATQVITEESWFRDVLEPTVARRSTEIINLRGGTPAGSAAQAILGTIRSITTPTPIGAWFGAAVISDGSYGVPQGLIFGFPLAPRTARPGRSSRASTTTTTP